MQINCRLTSFTVFKEYVSISLLCDTTGGINELKELSEEQEIRINDIRFTVNIKSIGFNPKRVRVLLHAPKNKYTIDKLFTIIDFDRVVLKIKTVKEKKIERLLNMVSEIRKASPEEILYQLTTFKNKDGKVIEGKRSVDEISRSCGDVVLSKLNKIIRQNATT